MNAIDGTDHYERSSDAPPPSLLTVILDTNPHAWAHLHPSLPLSKAVANILVFINAHLATNDANKIAVIASHTDRAHWLYPNATSSSPTDQAAADGEATRKGTAGERAEEDGDIAMLDGSSDAPGPRIKLKLKAKPAQVNGATTSTQSTPKPTPEEANKYRPFHLIEQTVLTNLRTLISTTSPDSLSKTYTTLTAGALSLALTYSNKLSQSPTSASSNNNRLGANSITSGNDGTTPSARQGLQPRILLISVSSSNSPEYIPLMNSIFAAQRLHIPIDILKLAGDTVFLQQACDATNGIYLEPEVPEGLLQYLMMAYLPDQRAREKLVMPGQVGVDFRAACFCHRRVVEIGFVCSICLSIFCEPPPDQICLTCGTHLQLGNYGNKPAVVPRKKKKRKKGIDGIGTPGTPGTPRPS